MGHVATGVGDETPLPPPTGGRGISPVGGDKPN
jgi:hypothetical protein